MRRSVLRWKKRFSSISPLSNLCPNPPLPIPIARAIIWPTNARFSRGCARRWHYSVSPPSSCACVFCCRPNCAGHAHSVWLSLAFGALGFVIVPLAAWSYLKTQRGIERDEFEPNNALVLAFGATVALLGAGVLLYLFLTPSLPVAK